MRALLRGERNASPLMFAALLGLFFTTLAVLFLAIGYKSQLVNLKHVIYTRCTQRTAYDQANHLSVGADVVLYRSLLEQEQKTAALTPPRYRPAQQAQQAAIRQALATKEHAYAAGVIGSCNAYK